MGDFDTISAEILKKYQMDAHIRCHSFNPEKDYTDTDIALKLAQRMIGAAGRYGQHTYSRRHGHAAGSYTGQYPNAHRADEAGN